MIMWFVSRYKRCPSNRILVISGKTGEGNTSKCVHGGGAFIWPIIQEHDWLELAPIDVDVDLTGALSKQNIRVNVPSHFTIAISNEPGIMQNAAERLLKMTPDQIRETAREIIFGQLRVVIATMTIEDINNNREQFLESIRQNVETELKKIGLHLINVNIRDIKDESGYIDALGKQAAAIATQNAKVSTAEAERDGEIGAANANQDRKIKVANADSLAKVGESQAEAAAVEGINLAKVKKENSNSQTEIDIATARTNALKAELGVQDAKKSVEKKKKEIEQVVDQEIEKEKAKLIADANAYTKSAEYDAEAGGIKKILEAQAAGIEAIVKASGGNPKDAAMLMLVDKIKDLATIQADAMKGIKVDKLTVFDGGNGNGLSNAVNGLFKSMPALSDFLAQSGMSLPDILGGKAKDNGMPVAPAAEVTTPAS